MDAFQAYVLSVTAAAILCTIARCLIGEKGSTAAIIRIVCGIIMATVILQPICNRILPDLSLYLQDLELDISKAVDAGTEHTQQALHDRISQQTVAYIQEKAQMLGISLDVQVELDDGSIPKPINVQLTGNVSPTCKRALSDLIEKDLGIRKEDQIWK